MRKLKLAVSLLFAFSTIVGMATAPATAAEPVAVVSINNLDALKRDLEFLFDVTGTKMFSQFVMPQVENYVQGLDQKRPIGVVLYVDGMEFKPMGFLPVDDLDTFLTQIQDQVGEAADAGGGVLELQGPQQIFIKEKGGWAFVGPSVESLDDVPANPMKLLAGLQDKYDIAVRGYVQNVPAAYREMAMQKMSEAMQEGLEQVEDEDAAAMAKVQMAELKKLSEQADEITWGWNTDSKARQTFMDFSFTAKPGTEIATNFAAMKGLKSKYSGFVVPGAAVSGNVSSVIPENQIDQNIAMLANFEKSVVKEIEQDDDIDDEKIRSGAKKLITGVFDILRDTIRTGKMDSAMSVVLKDGSMTLGMGSHVADGKKVEGLVKDLVELAKNEPDINFKKLKLNSEKHGDVQFHEIGIEIPDDEYIGEVFGGTLEICLGTSQDDMYLAIGSDPASNLKKMITNSKTASTVAPAEFTVKLAPILKFAEAMEGDANIGQIAEMLEENGQDHIRLKANVIDNGVSYRFLIEEGVLQALGQVVGMRMGAGGGF